MVKIRTKDKYMCTQPKMDKVNSKNSRAVLMHNKYQNINTEVMYSIPEV